MKIGIMGAMVEEVAYIKQAMKVEKIETYAGREFYCGTLDNYPFEVVTVLSHCGKVASACTAAILLEKYEIDFVIFTGVAGAADHRLNIGDVVIGDMLFQHDLDAEPFSPKFCVPLTNKSEFKPERRYIELAKTATENYLKNLAQDIGEDNVQKFKLDHPKAVIAPIATGDQFISDAATNKNMHFDESKNASAVEMEGAAVAQVCEDFDKPYIVIRTISDKADHSAIIDFQDFIDHVSNHYSLGVVRGFLANLG